MESDLHYSDTLTATIVSVEWERFHLYLEIETEGFQGSPRFYLATGKGQAGCRLHEITHEGTRYRVALDITNDGHNRCIKAGTYRLNAVDEDNAWTETLLSTEIGRDAASWSRIFPYNAARQAYTVYFDLDKAADEAVLLLRIFTMQRYTDGERPKPHLKRSVKRGFRQFKCFWLDKYYRLVHACAKSDKPVVLFVSEQDDHLRSNLLAVHNRMFERGLQDRFNIEQSCRLASSKRQGWRCWFSLLSKLARADYVFIDDHAPVLDWLTLSKDTKLVQLWHAGAGFKASGYARWGRTGAPKPVNAHRQYEFGISGSRKIACFFSEVFGIGEEHILPLGMPRMDRYLEPEHIEETKTSLYQKYPLCKNKEVILFAPTYRGRNKKKAMYPYDKIDFTRLYESCGDRYVVIFKMHPWVSEPVPIPEKYRDRFIDANTYPDINDLFYITDLLISDYSSNIFEFSLMHKPMLFFAFDEVEYAFTRGFHRPYEENLPGNLCRTFDEVLDAIEREDFQPEKVEEYVKMHFDYVDCGASDRAIDWILLDKMPQDLRDAIKKHADEIAQTDALRFDRTPILESREN